MAKPGIQLLTWLVNFMMSLRGWFSRSNPLFQRGDRFVPRNDIFILRIAATCFAILTLVIGCVPSPAAPISTLDPNSINLLIAQTADAASAQTMAAMPTFTSTATFTPTPRNTYTPEPTLTPIQTFILPSVTATVTLPYYRVKHDNQLAMFNYKSRTAGDWSGGPQTPEVVPMYTLPKLSSGTARATVDGRWEVFINLLNNNNEAKLNYLKARNSALFNTAGFPQLESLTMGGNVIQLAEIKGDWGRVHTLDLGQELNPLEVNYVTRPDLVHKFVVVEWDRGAKVTRWVNPPQGDTYWPLVSSRPVWIPLERLESFPILPMDVVANTTQSIRATPELDGTLTGFKLLEGHPVTVVEYYPSGSEVWGRLQSGGWITLVSYLAKGLHYFTSWTMATAPPIP